MSSEVAISVDHVGKTYRLYDKPSDRLWQILRGSKRQYFKEFTAVSDIDFRLNKGEVLGVVGVNGAGKSTLLQLIAGTISPSSGSLKTHGRIAALLELGSGFNLDFTGRENIYLNAATLGLAKREIDQRIDEIIAFADIGVHIDQPVKTYSSGMHVRLAFSIATSVDPDVLIIDEALSVGDGAFARRSFDRVMKIKERGATVLFCSHTLFHVEVFCDRALWLHQGRVQKIGPVSQVLSTYQEFLDALADPGVPVIASADPETSPMAMALADAAAAATAAVTAATAATATTSVEPAAEAVSPALSPPTGHARIESVAVSLDEHQGQELFGVSGVSTLRMHIDFRSDPAQPAPSAALVLSSESGRILATHLACARGHVFARDNLGNGSAEIRLENIPLNKGRFRVGAYLMCERGIHVYQWIDPVAYIQLHHDGSDQGYFLINADWSSTAK
ncbi:MAG: ABC transporter ATP-binding protein [Comamonadaceae bacterium]